MSDLRIQPVHDLALYRRLFQKSGRIHIPAFLEPDSANRLHKALAEFAGWKLFVNHADMTAELGAQELMAIGQTQREELFARIQADARRGFQFQYLYHLLSEQGEAYAGADARLAELTAFLNSTAFLAFARAVSGADDIAFADGQISRYEPGHFLTRHNDLRANTRRRLAYVINLTPQWRAEWGGVLEFLDEDGHVAEGYVPAFNAINLFRVPQMHHVSSVVSFAGGPRLSVTGWLRAH